VAARLSSRTTRSRITPLKRSEQASALPVIHRPVLCRTLSPETSRTVPQQSVPRAEAGGLNIDSNPGSSVLLTNNTIALNQSKGQFYFGTQTYIDGRSTVRLSNIGLTDFAGAPRVQNAKGLATAIIDMGAYEHTGIHAAPIPADFSLSATPMVVDLSQAHIRHGRPDSHPEQQPQAQVSLACSGLPVSMPSGSSPDGDIQTPETSRLGTTFLEPCRMHLHWCERPGAA